MKKILLSFVLISTASLATAPAVPVAAPAVAPTASATTPAGRLERDLGHGLVYYRLHALPADLPVATARRGATILDLRYTRSELGATTALGDWLKSHCARTTPVFVLLNADTTADVLAWFSSREPMAGLVTLGTAGPGFTPDIALNVHPAAERAAYDALEHGSTVESLLTDNTDKPRHDEAAIALERTAPAGDSSDSDTDIANPGETAPVALAAPRPVIDYVLLRAVQLDRSLVALRRI